MTFAARPLLDAPEVSQAPWANFQPNPESYQPSASPVFIVRYVRHLLSIDLVASTRDRKRSYPHSEGIMGTQIPRFNGCPVSVPMGGFVVVPVLLSRFCLMEIAGNRID